MYPILFATLMEVDQTSNMINNAVTMIGIGIVIFAAVIVIYIILKARGE
jgi:hypothetical protein